MKLTTAVIICLVNNNAWPLRSHSWLYNWEGNEKKRIVIQSYYLPCRYIHQGQLPNTPYPGKMVSQNTSTSATMNGTSSPALEIPTVDFSAWRESNRDARLRVARDLVRACKDVGFVYIINHGLDESLLEDAFSWSKKLFSLSQEDKMRAPHPEGWAVHRGYSWPGLEKVSQEKTQGDSDDDEELVKKLREVVDCKVGDG